jgi:hypothetical protein
MNRLRGTTVLLLLGALTISTFLFEPGYKSQEVHVPEETTELVEAMAACLDQSGSCYRQRQG